MKISCFVWKGDRRRGATVSGQAGMYPESKPPALRGRLGESCAGCQDPETGVIVPLALVPFPRSVLLPRDSNTDAGLLSNP
jgi:hypothetical protein